MSERKSIVTPTKSVNPPILEEVILEEVAEEDRQKTRADLAPVAENKEGREPKGKIVTQIDALFSSGLR